MNILVVGSGGREHALAWKILQSSRSSKVFVAPGNAGTALEPGLTNVNITAIPELIEFAKQENVALTVVGPEAPLSQGIVDAFRAAGLRIFGPTRAAAQLEWSKGFAKDFLAKHNIPTAQYQTFSDAKLAHEYVNVNGAPIVIKADGLAAGKGVIVAMTQDEAHAAIDDMLEGNRFGDAGARVVVEEFLSGEEASFIVMVDGNNVLPMATSQDHKRLLDGDAGPNTGGMGAYSPAPVVTPDVHARVMREIILPTVEGMKRDGTVFTGFLYAGLMIDQAGAPRVIEFNCRFGDPETQPIMLRLKSDFVALLEAGIDGKLDQVTAEWDRRAALGVVMAAANYPESPRKGDVISGLPSAQDDSHVFHAGTALNEAGLPVTAGGRVLCVTAFGENFKAAQKRAYDVLSGIHFEGMQYRRDIGWRGIDRK